jgi:hypothetical protein
VKKLPGMQNGYCSAARSGSIAQRSKCARIGTGVHGPDNCGYLCGRAAGRGVNNWAIFRRGYALQGGTATVAEPPTDGWRAAGCLDPAARAGIRSLSSPVGGKPPFVTPGKSEWTQPLWMRRQSAFSTRRMPPIRPHSGRPALNRHYPNSTVYPWYR